MSQSNTRTDQARARWAAEYRANRAASRLWDLLIKRSGGKVEGVPSFVDSTPDSFNFSHSRLSGDFLHGRSSTSNPHRLRLIQRQSPRLPA